MEKLLIREQLEKDEKLLLSAFAQLASQSRGTLYRREPCPMRTIYMRDRDRIVHSESFRRLLHKTQVFLIPKNDHYRTRLTHTLEVNQIAKTIAKVLKLNVDLTEGIALGHDLGHTPFGHAGEGVLNSLYFGGFNHNEQSLRIIDHLEKGIGLNLSFEIRDGILKHAKRGQGLVPENKNLLPVTLEGQVVRICDTIAYINHDIDDALRFGILHEEDLPGPEIEILGKTCSRRIHNMVAAVINASLNQPIIKINAEIHECMETIRRFLLINVYNHKKLRNDHLIAERIISSVYRYYLSHPDELDGMFDKRLYNNDEVERKIADYIAGMTDNFLFATYKNLKKQKK